MVDPGLENGSSLSGNLVESALNLSNVDDIYSMLLSEHNVAAGMSNGNATGSSYLTFSESHDMPYPIIFIFGACTIGGKKLLMYTIMMSMT